MTNNYEIIKKTVKSLMYAYYSLMESDLEYIFNSPSTINRIIVYYKISTHMLGGGCALIFNDEKVIKTYCSLEIFARNLTSVQVISQLPSIKLVHEGFYK